MKIFFFRTGQQSKRDARRRLCAVINDDRLNVSQGKTIEKMKKDIAAVLKKYSSDDAAENISITGAAGGECILAARISLKTAP